MIFDGSLWEEIHTALPTGVNGDDPVALFNEVEGHSVGSTSPVRSTPGWNIDSVHG